VTVLDHLHKSNLIDFSYMYRHNTINTTYQSSKFYNYYNDFISNTRLYLQLPQLTCDPVDSGATLTPTTPSLLKSWEQAATRFLKVLLLSSTTNLPQPVVKNITSFDQRQQG